MPRRGYRNRWQHRTNQNEFQQYVPHENLPPYTRQWNCATSDSSSRPPQLRSPSHPYSRSRSESSSNYQGRSNNDGPLNNVTDHNSQNSIHPPSVATYASIEAAFVRTHRELENLVAQLKSFQSSDDQIDWNPTEFTTVYVPVPHPTDSNGNLRLDIAPSRPPRQLVSSVFGQPNPPAPTTHPFTSSVFGAPNPPSAQDRQPYNSSVFGEPSRQRPSSSSIFGARNTPPPASSSFHTPTAQQIQIQPFTSFGNINQGCGNIIKR